MSLFGQMSAHRVYLISRYCHLYLQEFSRFSTFCATAFYIYNNSVDSDNFVLLSFIFTGVQQIQYILWYCLLCIQEFSRFSTFVLLSFIFTRIQQIQYILWYCLLCFNSSTESGHTPNMKRIMESKTLEEASYCLLHIRILCCAWFLQKTLYENYGHFLCKMRIYMFYRVNKL